MLNSYIGLVDVNSVKIFFNEINKAFDERNNSATCGKPDLMLKIRVKEILRMVQNYDDSLQKTFLNTEYYVTLTTIGSPFKT